MKTENAIVSDSAARASAYTITALHLDAHVGSIVLDYEPEPGDPWIAWASGCSCCGPRKAAPQWSTIAILAAEVIALRPEVSGSGPRWDAINLEGLKIAARLTRVVPEIDVPLWWVGNGLCGEWWESETGEKRSKLMKEAETEFMNTWHVAMEIVRRFRPRIDALADILQREREMSGEELAKFWARQLT